MASLGQESCRNVGWTGDCPAGFERPADGRGCSAVVPNEYCDAPSFAVLGNRSCQPLGTCGELRPEVPGATGPVLYVDPTSTAGTRDGRAGTPYVSLGEALRGGGAGWRNGTTLVLAPGVYSEDLGIDAGKLTIIGTCQDQVVIDGGGTKNGLLATGTAQLELQNLTIRNHRFGIRIQRNAMLTAKQVDVTGNLLLGLGVRDDTIATLEGVAIRNTRGGTMGEAGLGLEVVDGAHVELDGCLIDNNRKQGVLVSGGATTIIRDSIIRRTQPEMASGLTGQGLQANLASNVVIERSLFAENTLSAVAAFERDTVIELSDVVIQDTQPGSDSTGRGVGAAGGARLIMSRGVISTSVGSGILVESATVAISNVVIRDTRPNTNNSNKGDGVEVGLGSSATLQSVELLGNQTTGLFAHGAGTSVRLLGSRIADTRPRESDQLIGAGIHVLDHASVTISQSLIEANHQAGILCARDAVIAVRSAIIRDTRKEVGSNEAGDGIIAIGRCRVSIERSSITRNVRAGVLVQSGPIESG